MPIKQVVISMAVGMVSFFIVLISGLTSDYVSGASVASRSFSAFSFTSLVSFIFLMSCEEYAIYTTKRELEDFIDTAPFADTDENFNRAQYLHEEPEPPQAVDDGSFQPMNFGQFANQH